MVGGAGEPDQGAVAARRRVDALRVGGGHVRQDLDLGLDDAERLGVRAPDGASGALGLRRLPPLLLPELDDLLEQRVDVRIDLLDIRAVPHEIGHVALPLFHLLAR